MPTKLAIFDWTALNDRNLEKLKKYKNDGWDVYIIGNGLDCTSRLIPVSECKKGMFTGWAEKQIESVDIYSNGDACITYTDESISTWEYDDYQEVRVSDNSLQVEVEKMRALVKELDIKLGLLCPDNGFSVYFVRPYEEFHETYHRTQCCFEGQGLNFRLPNDGMIEIAKRAFHYRETRTVYLKLWWLYWEWQEKTDDEFVFIGVESD